MLVNDLEMHLQSLGLGHSRPLSEYHEDQGLLGLDWLPVLGRETKS
jgi:hypothetical protein